MRLNGTGKRKIASDFGVDLQVYNNYLYYLIYGTGIIKRIDIIGDDRVIQEVFKPKNYKQKAYRFYFWNNKMILESEELYTTDLDGGNIRLLYNSTKCDDALIQDNLIIINSYRVTDDKRILSTFNLRDNKLNVLDDATSKHIDENNIFYAKSTGMVVGDDEKIYYTLSDGTYRINLDGSGKALLTDKSLPC